MLTTMTDEDWTIVLKVFEASRSRRGDKGRNDRKFLEALQYFVVHNITWLSRELVLVAGRPCDLPGCAVSADP
jgi:hypothetical protein